MTRGLAQLRLTTSAILEHPANKGRALRALTRFAAYQAWERLVRRPLPVRFEGLTLLCFPHETSSAAVVYNRLPEWEEMHFVRSFLSPGDHFVDVGANVGVYSLLAASIADVHVDAFEPATVARRRLCANVERNGLGERVRVHAVAVGGVEGEAVLTTDRGTMNRLDANTDTGEVVRVVRLDDAISRRPAIIKIDVEGGELDVLAGAERTIAEHQPALLVEANEPARLEQWRDAHGYEAFRYDVAHTRLVPAEVGAHANVILLPRS